MRAVAGAVAGVVVAAALAGCTPTTTRSSSQVVVVSDDGTRTVSHRSVSNGSKGSTGSGTDAGRAVVITAAGNVCWRATVDGRRRSGCGDGRIADTRGAAGGSVTKTGGPTRVGVRLVVDGRTVDRGSVWRTGRTTSVRG